MTSQMEIGTGQLTFVHPFCIPFTPGDIPSVVTPQPVKKTHSAQHGSVSAKIIDKRERILELQKQMEDNEEAILNRGREEEDFDPEGEEEDIFDVVVPDMESALYGVRVETETEIKLLEEEIKKLERKGTSKNLK